MTMVIISTNLEKTIFIVEMCQNVPEEIKKKNECVVKTQDRSETFVLQGNIVIIHQSLLNSIFTTKLYILMKKKNIEMRNSLFIFKPPD
jgi:hypothetical protein